MNETESDWNEKFSRDGFVALPGFLSQPLLGELDTRVCRFIENIVPQLPSASVFYEDKSDLTTLKQIQHLENHDPWFHELITVGRFREVAEVLLAGAVVPKNLQYFNKPPRIGNPTPPHQDGYYFMLAPCEAVTMWLALDEVSDQNGCVHYVRGSNRLGMREHAATQTLGFSQGIVNYPSAHDAENETACPAQPGDLLVHDALTIHRAGGNVTADRSRRAIGFIYYSERAREDKKSHQAYQRKLEAELKAAGKI